MRVLFCRFSVDTLACTNTHARAYAHTHTHTYTQAEFKEAYATALVDLKDEVKRIEGPQMKDKLREPRHLWITDKIADTKQVLLYQRIGLSEFYST